MDELYVYVKFVMTDPVFPEFRDALFIPYAQYLSIPAQTLNAMKAARHQNWKLGIQNPVFGLPGQEGIIEGPE